MIWGLSSALAGDSIPPPRAPNPLPANACPPELRCCRARGLYTDPLFIGRLRARMRSEPHSSAVLALLTWERRERAYRMEEGAVALLGPTVCLVLGDFIEQIIVGHFYLKRVHV